ncbi:penicillin-binding protein [uncultured Thomasclavelia sp.]|uniref:penicillin-binding protein n=1 Tax=uncultured Thomasclavelia sp. TaxID=3025759 RepID=UPI0025CFE99A|nr:penicillin-binding protein [uncultured Thomasclavelia sp.]
MKQFKSAKIAYVVFALVIFSLVANIVYLGITGKHLISGEDIAAFAKSRGKAETVEYAQRGEIFTSDNEVVATNVKKYKLIAVLSSDRINFSDKAAYVQDIETTANTIGPIIGMDPTTMAAQMQEKADAGVYQVEFGTYGSNLSASVKKQIEDTDLPGLEFEDSNSRNYPFGDFCSYIIGYAKSSEENSVKKLVGEMGLEAIYDDTLAGEDGYKVYQKDSKGYILPNGILEEKDAVDGQDIYLTINSSLQRELDYQLATEAAAAGANKASCTIMEAKTGRILATSTYPSFNPNERNISDYKNFLFDTAYECGSVFKTFVYASSIESGLYSGEATYESGSYDYGASRPIRDHNNGAGWGTITFNEGFYRSSNVAICNLLERGYTNREDVEQVYEDLGLFQESEVDGFDAVAGVALYKSDDSRAAYLTTGFGQGSTVTSLQLLKAYSAFANDGKTVEPYLIDRIVDKNNNEVTYSAKTQYSKQIFSTETVQEIRDLLKGVVTDATGTGKKFALDNGVQVIGKTGTGQLVEDGAYSTTNYTKSFMGMAPYEDPQIIVNIVFQGPDNDTTTHQANVIKNIMPTALSIVSSYNAPATTTTSEDYTLDSFTNQSANFVKSKLESKSINVQIIGNGSTVLEQYPEATTQVTKNDRVFLKTESADITIPNFTGWSRKDVSTYASLSGINITIEGESGQVASQSVPEGTILHAGDTMTVAIQ